MDDEIRYRISDGTKMAMLFVATGFWLFSFIPIVNFFSNPMGWAIMWYWFKINGVSLGKNIGKNATSIVVGFIPLIGTLLSAFPGIIYMNIKTSRKEDETQHKNKQDSKKLDRATRNMTAQLRNRQMQEAT